MSRPTQANAAVLIDFLCTSRPAVASMAAEQLPAGRLQVSVVFSLSAVEARALRDALRGLGVDTQAPPEQGVLLEAEPAAPRMLTPRERVFAYGVPLLLAAGCKEATARSMLAGLCRDHGEAAVAEAVDETARSGAVSPASFLQALLRGTRRTRRNRQEALEDENAAVAARFLAAGGQP